MSDTGLYSGIYQLMREHAELIDEVLIGLKDGSGSTEDSSRQKLAKTLTNMANPKSDNLSIRLLAQMLRDKDGGYPTKWTEISAALLSKHPTPSLIEDLEILAR